MNELMDILYKLEEIDSRVFKIQVAMGDLPLRKNQLENEYNMLKEKYDGLKNERENLNSKNNEMEKENEDIKTQIQSDKEFLNTVKSNEEYMRIVNGIKTKNETMDKNQDEIIKNLTKIEEIDKEIEKLNEEMNKDDSVSNRLKKTQEELEKDENEISELKGKRLEIIEKLPEDIKRKYLKIYDRRKGLAIVLISNNFCSGCFSEIPKQLVQDLESTLSHRDCLHCGRILLWNKYEDKSRN